MHALRRAVAHHHADIFLIRERRKRARVVLLFTLVLAHGHSLHCTRAVGEVMSSTLLAVPFVATAAAPIVFAAALALTTLDAS